MEARQEIPQFAIERLQILNDLDQFANAAFVDRADFPENKTPGAFPDLHGMGMGNFPSVAHGIHAMVELIADPGTDVETRNEAFEVLLRLFVGDLGLGETLNEVEPCSRRIEGCKNGRLRDFVGLEKQHEHIDEHALVIRTAEDEISNQCQHHLSDGRPS